MTKFVSIAKGKASDSPTLKYVKQTYDMLLNAESNLELVAIQISKLPVREQKKFFRLMFNYIDTMENTHFIGLADMRSLCNKLMEVINKHYEEQ
jgi:hypothetical protein